MESSIDSKAAGAYVPSIFAGLAPVLSSRNRDLAELAGDHATPGGINERFLASLKEAGMFDDVRTGLNLIAERLVPKPR